MDCGINGKLMQRLETEARVEWQRRIRRSGVTGEVIHEESSLHREDRRQRDAVRSGAEKMKMTSDAT